MKIKVKAIFLLSLNLLYAGCSFLNIGIRDSGKSNTSFLDIAKKPPENNSCVIMGQVRSKNEYNQSVLVIAYSVNFPEKTFNDYVILDEPGEYMLYLPEGKYQLYSVIDKNNNTIFEKNEVTGVYGNPDTISINRGDVLTGINIDSNAAGENKIQFPKKIEIIYDYDSIVYLSKNGMNEKIYNEIFSHKNAVVGWKAPSLFMNAFGANIYLTEKYDPKKIPILFVHGAQGTPRDWVNFFIRLDKKHYQPFFFYYPSGLRLPLLSKLLYEKIKELKQKYNFSKICLTAHSMGGLVTRSMLTQYKFENENDFIKLYVTFATPWSGFKSADFALKTSPYILPSWIDVASRSLFIKRTLRKKLPVSIDYYLFYGKYDKTSQEKALDGRACVGAKGKFGFDTDHDKILSDKNVFVKFNEILSHKFFAVAE